jgi:hypothetical protein
MRNASRTLDVGRSRSVSVGHDFLVEPVKGYMAYIPALDHINNELSDIGSVVPDTLKAFAMNMYSGPTGIVRGASVICMTSLRPNARNELSTASSSRTICAAATASIRANASRALRRIIKDSSPDLLSSVVLMVPVSSLS